MSKEKHYINKDALWEEIRLYYEADDENKANGGDGAKMGNKLGNMIAAIAMKLMSAKNFSGYVYRQEMEGDAMLRMVSTITGRKFNLFSNKKGTVLTEMTFRGYIAIENDCLGEDEIVVVTNSDDLAAPQSVFKRVDGEYFLDDKNRLVPYFVRVREITDCFMWVDPNDYPKGEYPTIEVLACHDTGRKRAGRIVFEEKDLVCCDKKPILRKNNAFGYLSLISNREAITRIKRENKNYDAIHEYQEDEFLKFLSDNPEMAQQRVFDDTYESFQNG